MFPLLGIHVDGGHLSAPLRDFPLPVVLMEGEDLDHDAVDPAGLRFVDDTGEVVPHEIELWPDVSGDRSVLWVRVPELTPSGTTLWLLADRGSAPDPAEVWLGAPMVGVWHPAAEGFAPDVSGNEAFQLNVLNAAPVEGAFGWGVLPEEYDVFGSGMVLAAAWGPYGTTPDISLPMTLSEWVLATTPPDGTLLFAGPSAPPFWTLEACGGGAGLIFRGLSVDPASCWAAPLDDGDWHLVSVWIEEDQLSLFVDGLPLGGPVGAALGTQGFIGVGNTVPPTPGLTHAAPQDELRLADGLLSEDWMRTELLARPGGIVEICAPGQDPGCEPPWTTATVATSTTATSGSTGSTSIESTPVSSGSDTPAGGEEMSSFRLVGGRCDALPADLSPRSSGLWAVGVLLALRGRRRSSDRPRGGGGSTENRRREPALSKPLHVK